MALPPFYSIFDDGDQNQSFTGNDTNENSVIVSLGGVGTIEGFKIKGEGGNDTITLTGDPVGTNVFGGDGEDVLTVGPNGAFPPSPRNYVVSDSKFFAGADNDTVNLVGVLVTGTAPGLSQVGTGEGGDLINYGGQFIGHNTFAGDGNDEITFLSDGTYTRSRLFSGDGDDTVNDGGFELDLTASEFGFKGGDDVVDFGNSFAGEDEDGIEVFLGDGDDSFVGPYAGDVTALGGAGDDTIETFDGDDSIEGGDDNDSILSGDGRDTVLGGEGCDTIHGQEDEDSLFGDAGTDAIFGENGDDTIDGGADADFVSGGFGDDSITGGLGVSPEPTIGDVLNDILGQPQSDADGPISEFITDGDSLLCTIFSEDDTLVGNVGNDTIRGESGNDIIWAGSWNNLSEPDTSDVNEIINEKFDLDGDDTINIGELPDNGIGEEFVNEDKVNEGEGANDQDDSVLGNSGNDIIFGSRGNDTLLGGSGHDIIMGNQDGDSMSGGQGSDIFIQENGASEDVNEVQQGDNLTLNFGDFGSDSVPDIITDFLATDGAGNVVDQIAFEDWDGGFNNNLGSATAGFGVDNVVLYSGKFNALNNTFITTDNEVGPDVLAFRADESSGGTIDADEIGDQSVILLGAAGQGFSEANFIAF